MGWARPRHTSNAGLSPARSSLCVVASTGPVVAVCASQVISVTGVESIVRRFCHALVQIVRQVLLA